MKTTITIDDDVSASLDCLRNEKHTKLDAIINDILRSGLKEIGVRPARTFATAHMDAGVFPTSGGEIPADIASLTYNSSPW